MPHTVPCNADDLLGLIAIICGLRWDQKERVKIMHHLMGGHFPIFCDGKPLKEDVKMEIPGVAQRFNKLLDDIYLKGILPDAAAWGLSQRWKMAIQIIAFGKDRGLSRADWGEALRKKI